MNVISIEEHFFFIIISRHKHEKDIALQKTVNTSKCVAIPKGKNTKTKSKQSAVCLRTTLLLSDKLRLNPQALQCMVPQHALYLCVNMGMFAIYPIVGVVRRSRSGRSTS